MGKQKNKKQKVFADNADDNKISTAPKAQND